MKSTLNVIRTSLAAGICLSLLVACDGRGAAAFKSYRYTPEQLKEQQKLKEAEANRLGGNPGNLPAVDPEGISTSKDAPKSEIFEPAPAALPPSPATPPLAGEDPAAPANPAAPAEEGKLDPSSKFFVEFGKLEPEQRKISKRTKLQKLVDEKVTGEADAQAAAMLKEISFTKVANKSLMISLKAALAMDGQERFLFVEGEPVSFGDGDVIPLNSELHETREMNGTPIAKGDSIFTLAYCPTNDCKFIHVLFDFAGKNERIYAAFILEATADKFVVHSHNLGPGLKEFADAVKAGDAPAVAEGDKPAAADDTKPADVNPSDANPAKPDDVKKSNVSVSTPSTVKGPLEAADAASAFIGKQRLAAAPKQELAKAATGLTIPSPVAKAASTFPARPEVVANNASKPSTVKGPLEAADAASSAIAKQRAAVVNKLSTSPSAVTGPLAAADAASATMAKQRIAQAAASKPVNGGPLAAADAASAAMAKQRLAQAKPTVKGPQEAADAASAVIAKQLADAKAAKKVQTAGK